MHLKVWKIWGIWLWVKFAKHVLHGPFRLLSFAHGSIFTLALVEKNHTSSSRQSKKKLRRFDVEDVWILESSESVWRFACARVRLGRCPFLQTAGFSCEFAGIQVKLCWKRDWEKLLCFLPGKHLCLGMHTVALWLTTILCCWGKRTPKSHGSHGLGMLRHRSHPGWKCTTSPLKGLWSWFSRFEKKMEDFSDGCGLPASKWSLPVSYRFAKSDRTHQCLAAIDEATSLFLSSAPLSPERTSTTMCEDCWDIIFFKSFSSSKSTECMYPILFAAMSPTWNPTEQKLGLLAK